MTSSFYGFSLHFSRQTVLSDNNVLMYSQAHMAVFFLVAWRFLMQCSLRAWTSSALGLCTLWDFSRAPGSFRRPKFFALLLWGKNLSELNDDLPIFSCKVKESLHEISSYVTLTCYQLTCFFINHPEHYYFNTSSLILPLPHLFCLFPTDC